MNSADSDQLASGSTLLYNVDISVLCKTRVESHNAHDLPIPGLIDNRCSMLIC